jgi:2-C-methyl-D-erythritol 4-phosphate cytidylyltransferase
MPDQNRYALIVAGGSGSRMKQELPKQFIPLGGKPVLMHTVEQFYNVDPAIKILLVLPPDQVGVWQELCQVHGFFVSHQVALGGPSRFASVRNGLAKIEGEGLVAVHDGVRPFVSAPLIRAAFDEAEEYGNAVAAVPLKDSIRRLSVTGSHAEDRSHFRLIQTPQCFRLDLLRQAYTQPEDPTFTDDASVVERLGVTIRLVNGTYENIKITTPEDLLWAEAFLQSPEKEEV